MKRSKVYFNLAPIGQYLVQQIGIYISVSWTILNDLDDASASESISKSIFFSTHL
jgi:hypothetical protein